MLRTALAVVLLPLAVQASALVKLEKDHAVHEELRGVLTGVQEAINAKRWDDLAPFFSEKMRVTTINQEVLSSRDEIAPYFKKWFGEGGFLKDLTFTLSADDLTELDKTKTYGIVRGSGVENYVLADGRRFDLKTRWTATVVKDADKKWRILALHIGTNFLDNPILDAAKDALVRAAVLGVFGGLVVGALLASLFQRRKTKRRA
jgi:hypothetical protein